jgi:hypothetical protein
MNNEQSDEQIDEQRDKNDIMRPNGAARKMEAGESDTRILKPMEGQSVRV